MAGFGSFAERRVERKRAASGRLLRWGAAGCLLLLGLGIATLQAAPLLHEYFDFDSDASGGAAAGRSAEMETGAAGTALAAGQSNAADRDYRLDGDTSRPDQVGYEDPFTPSIPPFKRLYAYDAVGEDFELTVYDPRLSALNVGSRPAPEDDQFFADMHVTLSPGEALRVPSVGPGARVLAAQTLPTAQIELLRDGAENWFVRSPSAGDFRLILHIAIDRDVFGSAFASTTWNRLGRLVPPISRALLREADPVLARLQLDHRTPPEAAVRALIAYFRNFEPSDETFAGSGAALYQRIALAQRGVCRHRAFAFMVTALALGIPTRFVHNEAHAWVEVSDGTLWHRIDLGGAAGSMAFTAPMEAAHEAPRDPYPWPTQHESGRNLARQAFQRQESASRDSETPAASDSSPTPASTDGQAHAEVSPGASAGPDTASSPSSERHAALPVSLSVRSSLNVVQRGRRLHISGRAQAAQPCSLLRVDIGVRTKAASFRLGTLVTDAEGRFAGELPVSEEIPLGDYVLIATTPGNAQCAPAESPPP